MYEEILKACKEWVYSIQDLYADKLYIDIDLDNSNELVVNIDSNKYLSQLVVSKPECRPFEFVEFTILNIDTDIESIPAFWYGDKKGDTVQEIIDNLNRGLMLLL